LRRFWPAGALALLVIALLTLPAPGVAGAAGYRPCGHIGTHRPLKVSAAAMRCVTARRYARRLVRTHHGPRGWHCVTAQLRQGFGGCARGNRAFSVVPYRR
jgi:hypothetical protein